MILYIHYNLVWQDLKTKQNGNNPDFSCVAEKCLNIVCLFGLITYPDSYSLNNELYVNTKLTSNESTIQILSSI